MEDFKKHIKNEIENLKKEIKENVLNENYDTALNNIINLKSKQEMLKELF